MGQHLGRRIAGCIADDLTGELPAIDRMLPITTGPGVKLVVPQVAVVVLGFSGAPMELLLPFLLAYLLPIVMVWRDWARLPSSGQGSVLLVFCVIASALLGYALYKWAGVPLWLFASLQVALALGLGCLRWRRQMAAPQALPVGRLA